LRLSFPSSRSCSITDRPPPALDADDRGHEVVLAHHLARDPDDLLSLAAPPLGGRRGRERDREEDRERGADADSRSRAAHVRIQPPGAAQCNSRIGYAPCSTRSRRRRLPWRVASHAPTPQPAVVVFAVTDVDYIIVLSVLFARRDRRFTRYCIEAGRGRPGETRALAPSA
jgi:hypothetical protein